MYLLSATQQVHFTWNIGNQWSNRKGRIYFSLSNYCSPSQSLPSYFPPTSMAAPADSVMQYYCDLPHVQSAFCRCLTLKSTLYNLKLLTSTPMRLRITNGTHVSLVKEKIRKKIFTNVFQTFQCHPWTTRKHCFFNINTTHWWKYKHKSTYQTLTKDHAAWVNLKNIRIWD